MRILELDSGNTRLKWRLRDAGDILSRGVIDNDSDVQGEVSGLLKQLAPVHQARLAIVSGQERLEMLRQVIEAQSGIPLSVVKVRDGRLGLSLAYTTIGVDRWLAMLAAHHSSAEEHKAKTKLVVSCGTAMTVDVVSEGVHQGGFILPGLQLMKKALSTSTAQLELIEVTASGITPGKNSADCINNGVLAMASAMINAQVDRYPEAIVCLTGGDGELLSRFVSGEWEYRPELVMDGIALAFD
ncbi:type III pantothenate kinase [uncultured Endozoicomonas sp.]|uniref:type III pantothenate kinase n=1 Tax=uncultured Endozoicomonas sp. TaxID=432652 RepID=UPI0026035A7F|nr:type III pantothenate kinase [uncultured Endozoicomonas sp.]